MGSRRKKKLAKEGLYACYDISGIYTGRTKYMQASSAYNANKDGSYIWELVSDNPEIIYKNPESIQIPKEIEIDSGECFCDLCCEYKSKEEMDFIPSEEDLKESPGLCSQCKQCVENRY